MEPSRSLCSLHKCHPRREQAAHVLDPPQFAVPETRWWPDSRRDHLCSAQPLAANSFSSRIVWGTITSSSAFDETLPPPLRAGARSRTAARLPSNNAPRPVSLWYRGPFARKQPWPAQTGRQHSSAAVSTNPTKFFDVSRVAICDRASRPGREVLLPS